ncbi:MAG TPA: hypothetical protein ENN43_07165 [bacterium]|nr:hypothetical protein [bacterium]
MKCTDIESLLYDYIKNELSPARVSLVKRHIKECRSCERRYFETKGLSTLFNAESAAPPKKILKNLRKKYKTPFFPARLLRPAFTLMTVLMLAAGSFFAANSINKSKELELSSFLYDSYNISVEYYHDEQTNTTRVADFFEIASTNY